MDDAVRRAPIRSLRRLALVVAVAFLFLAVTGSAGATSVWLGGSVYRLFAKGSNGYSLRLSTYGNRRYHRISLTAENEAGQYARYSVEGVPRGGRISARFPGVGKIDVVLRPTKIVALPPPAGCKLPKAVIHYGLFEGTIELRGEKGYTKLDAKQARGRIETSQRQECQLATEARAAHGEPPRGGSTTLTTLQLVAGHVTVTGTAREGETEAFFTATARERRNGMGIVRNSPAVESPSDFEADSGLTWANAAPPAPFLGTATYSGPPRSTGCALPCPFPFGQASGSLRVPLPGLGVVPLTGPEVKAQLTEDTIAF
jgi:hypothetical protein